MVYVLLTDTNSGTLLVACPNQETASEVGSAAVWSDGGVSAWLVPDLATTQINEVIAGLREGYYLSQLNLDLTFNHLRETP
jgi:hypothetical protein